MHASTAVEGALKGEAALIDASGRYNRETATAAVQHQVANGVALNNRRKAIDTYYMAREQNRRYRATERGERLSAEALYRISQEAAPKRLSRYELDPVFGGIYWPAVLKDQRFAAERQAVEDMFRHRDEMTTPAHMAVDHATESMEAELKDMITMLKPNDYLQAKNFLRSLSHEARQAPSIEGVASNNVVETYR